MERGGADVAAVCSAHPGVLVIEPTSLMRGEGLIAGLLTLTAVAGALVVEPTSLRGGEGLAAGLLCAVGRELGGRGWWW